MQRGFMVFTSRVRCRRKARRVRGPDYRYYFTPPWGRGEEGQSVADARAAGRYAPVPMWQRGCAPPLCTSDGIFDLAHCRQSETCRRLASLADACRGARARRLPSAVQRFRRYAAPEAGVSSISTVMSARQWIGVLSEASSHAGGSYTTSGDAEALLAMICIDGRSFSSATACPRCVDNVSVCRDDLHQRSRAIYLIDACPPHRGRRSEALPVPSNSLHRADISFRDHRDRLYADIFTQIWRRGAQMVSVIEQRYCAAVAM